MIPAQSGFITVNQNLTPVCPPVRPSARRTGEAPTPRPAVRENAR
jgi:hypothetical protein